MPRTKPIPTSFVLFAIVTLAMCIASAIWAVSSAKRVNPLLSFERNAMVIRNDIHEMEKNQMTTINQPTTTNNDKAEAKFCTPQLKCPRNTDYHQRCKQSAIKPDNSFVQPPPLPTVQDPDNFVQNLQSFFHGKRVALIGDSLTRQWTETLSCRLGLHLQFYEIGKTSKPKRVVEAQQRNIKVNEARSPKGRGEIYPYMRAVPEIFLPLDPHDPLPSLEEEDEEPTNKGNKTHHDCKKLRTTLEYYKLDYLDRSGDLIGYFAQVADVDIIVFNIGAHYPLAKNYINDLRFLMDKCAKANSMNPTNTSQILSPTINNTTSNTNTTIAHGSKQALCLFRETFAKHSVSKDYNERQTSKPPKGPDLFAPFDKKLVRKECGPFLPDVYPLKMNPNSYVEDIARAYDIGVVKVEHFSKGAWKWHVRGDCTHFCHDDEFWDLVHESLIETATERMIMRSTKEISR